MHIQLWEWEVQALGWEYFIHFFVDAIEYIPIERSMYPCSYTKVDTIVGQLA